MKVIFLETEVEEKLKRIQENPKRIQKKTSEKQPVKNKLFTSEDYVNDAIKLPR